MKLLLIAALMSSVSAFAARPCQKFVSDIALKTCEKEVGGCDKTKTELASLTKTSAFYYVNVEFSNDADWGDVRYTVTVDYKANGSKTDCSLVSIK